MEGSPLADRVAVVTGASRGIGCSIAGRLAAAGARVVGGARSGSPAGSPAPPAPLAASSPGPGAVEPVYLDVTDPDSVGAVFDWVGTALGRLDVAVINAGVGVFAPIDELTERDFRHVLDVNLIGAFRCMKAAFALMQRTGGGRIIAVGSVADHVPLAGAAAYAASKYGLRGLCHALTEDGKAQGIFASVVSPGAVATDIWEGRPGFDRAEMLQPEDVATTVVDIASRPPHVRVDEVRLMPRRGVL